MDSRDSVIYEEELSPVEKGTMGANADVQEALQQLQVAEEQLAKAQQDRDKAAKILTRAGVAETAGFQGHPHALNTPSAVSDLSLSSSVREAAQYQRDRITGILDIETVATISSMNSMAVAEQEGERLQKIAQENIAEFKKWKEKFASESGLAFPQS